ncbi:MAG: hypothetical protein ACK41W_06730 [Cyanobacteriota bacterium]
MDDQAAIALPLSGCRTFRQDQHLHLIAGIGVARDRAATAKYFIVRMGGNNKNARGHFIQIMRKEHHAATPL